MLGGLNPEESKSIKLTDVYDLRKGTDSDRDDPKKVKINYLLFIN